MYTEEGGDEAPAYTDLSEERSGDSGRAPPRMRDEEIRRINEERRRKMTGGGFSNWRLKRKGNKEEVVR